ncbi:MAG: hypothetical protein P0107_05080 [Nitrosomonas sp.]|nr:hypothetical protein [Nitrosomonas sp.]
MASVGARSGTDRRPNLKLWVWEKFSLEGVLKLVAGRNGIRHCRYRVDLSGIYCPDLFGKHGR